MGEVISFCDCKNQNSIIKKDYEKVNKTKKNNIKKYNKKLEYSNSNINPTIK